MVEDEDAVRAMVCETLKGYGYAVLEARCGEEAMSLSGSHAGAIDLLLTDVVMPGMNGLELASRLADSRRGMPVLYMSGYAEEAVRRLRDAGAGAEFLQKPITPVILSARIAELLAGRGAPRA